MRLWITALCLFLFTGLAQADPAFFSPTDESPADFLPVERAFVFSHDRQPSGEVRLHWRIAPGYYLYRERLRFDGLPEAQRPVLPEGQAQRDEFFGDTQVYRDELELLIPAEGAQRMTLGWQGCADAGLCYPPQTLAFEEAEGGAEQGAAPAPDQRLASGLQERALAWNLALFFGLGLLLAFTPCSLPMLPILAGLVVGSGAGPRRGLLLAGMYVLSMALVYAALGVLAALLGGNLQAVLQQPWVIGGFAGLFVLLALPMFGFFELQLPAVWRDRLENAGRRRRGGSLVGAAVLGVLSGLLVGPCMSAPLAGALLFIAQSGSVVLGGLVLFALGIGIGTPLLLLVTLGNRFLPKPGAWMDLVKGLFGFLFLGTALVLLRPLLSEVQWVGFWGAWSLLLAHALRQVARQPGRYGMALGALALLLGLWGGALLLGSAGGATNPLRPLQVYAGSSAATVGEGADAFHTLDDPAELDRQLEQARAAGQWVLLDYYADWCVSCKVMERQVFGQAAVLSALEGVRLLRLDVTVDNPASRELLSRYRVLGPPSLLWIDGNGEERRGQRIVGELDAEAFLRHWNALREQG